MKGKHLLLLACLEAKAQEPSDKSEPIFKDLSTAAEIVYGQKMDAADLAVLCLHNTERGEVTDCSDIAPGTKILIPRYLDCITAKLIDSNYQCPLRPEDQAMRDTLGPVYGECFDSLYANTPDLYVSLRPPSLVLITKVLAKPFDPTKKRTEYLEACKNFNLNDELVFSKIPNCYITKDLNGMWVFEDTWGCI